MAQQLTNEHYEIAYNIVKERELDKFDIKDLAAELNESEEYDRNGNSAEFLLSRMYILVWGEAPKYETQNRAERMFTICNKMIEFAESVGLEAETAIELAKIELAERPIRIKRDDAKAVVSSYYFSLPKDDRPKGIDREAAIKLVMEGTPVEEALAA